MTRDVLVAIEVLLLAAIALPTELRMRRVRGPLLKGLERLGDQLVRQLARIADVVRWLLYVAFAAWALPFEAQGLATQSELESVLDTVALFALFIAALQILSFRILHRVGSHLERWPPKIGESLA